MRIRFDPTADILLIQLRDGMSDESDEVAPGMIVDFDSDGRPLATEILNVHRLLSPDRKLDLPFQRSVG
jgi:uncharacterized protein YuzE